MLVLVDAHVQKRREGHLGQPCDFFCFIVFSSQEEDEVQSLECTEDALLDLGRPGGERCSQPGSPDVIRGDLCGADLLQQTEALGDLFQCKPAIQALPEYKYQNMRKYQSITHNQLLRIQAKLSKFSEYYFRNSLGLGIGVRLAAQR